MSNDLNIKMYADLIIHLILNSDSDSDYQESIDIYLHNGDTRLT